MRHLILLLVFAGTCWGKSEIAKVTDLQGNVTASQPSQKPRTLALDSSIYVKDTIVVADDSAVQITYLDGAVLDLKPDTNFFIKDYKYGSGKDVSHSELASGGFRLLSGAMKPDPNQYNIKTPNATIGLLGTLLETDIHDDGIYVACTEGRVQISNAGGTIVIGEGMEQYAVVTSYLRRPQIFIAPPAPVIRPSIRPTIQPHH